MNLILRRTCIHAGDDSSTTTMIHVPVKSLKILKNFRITGGRVHNEKAMVSNLQNHEHMVKQIREGKQLEILSRWDLWYNTYLLLVVNKVVLNVPTKIIGTKHRMFIIRLPAILFQPANNKSLSWFTLSWKSSWCKTTGFVKDP